jgi:hypothetical protein
MNELFKITMISIGTMEPEKTMLPIKASLPG